MEFLKPDRRKLTIFILLMILSLPLWELMMFGFYISGAHTQIGFPLPFYSEGWYPTPMSSYQYIYPFYIYRQEHKFWNFLF